MRTSHQTRLESYKKIDKETPHKIILEVLENGDFTIREINVTLIGRLTKDPNFRTTDGGHNLATFTVAVNRDYKDNTGNRSTDFIPVITWNKTAEYCGKYLKKGYKVSIVGRFETRTYDAKDGTKRYVTEVNASIVIPINIHWIKCLKI